jgi:hypothetical protein
MIPRAPPLFAPIIYLPPPPVPADAAGAGFAPRHSAFLLATADFLQQRYLGYESVKGFFAASGASAYGTDTPGQFIVDHDFPFPVDAIRATHTPKSCFVEVTYAPDLLFASERLFFDPSSVKIVAVQTTYNSYADTDLTRRLTTCAGPEDPNMVAALRTTRLLHLCCRFLHADVTQDLDTQTALLADDVEAFGARGKGAVIDAQRDGIAAGTTYTVPFPLLVNAAAGCVSLDFFAHSASGTTPERGTDIMYADLRAGNVVRIDTLRHARQQPEWVRRHFAGSP